VAPGRDADTLVIDTAYVEQPLGELAPDPELSRCIPSCRQHRKTAVLPNHAVAINSVR